MPRFVSTKDSSIAVSFKEAVLTGLAPNQGLFVPEKIAPFSAQEIDRLVTSSPQKIALEIAAKIVGDEIDRESLRKIIEETVHFETPLKRLESGISILELFHGSSLAFKDFGARFLASYLSSLRSELTKKVVVLTATSGDTGAAVAHAFKESGAGEVFILFPKGKVSPLQQRQMTTVGGTVHALEVEGTFDDCQALVKQGLQDVDLTSRFHLTAANSINIGRLLPQIFYYFFAYAAVQQKDLPLYFTVPSGNFGNLCAGVFAQRLGLPIKKFIAATNANDVVPRYLSTGLFTPHATIATISNAMDVGSPNNFPRILHLCNNNLTQMRDTISGYAVTEEETIAAIIQRHRAEQYILDPHTAVGVCAAERFFKESADAGGSSMVVLGTAHPAKFESVLRERCGITPPIPASLAELQSKPERLERIHPRYDELKQIVLHTA